MSTKKKLSLRAGFDDLEKRSRRNNVILYELEDSEPLLLGPGIPRKGVDVVLKAKIFLLVVLNIKNMLCNEYMPVNDECAFAMAGV